MFHLQNLPKILFVLFALIWSTSSFAQTQIKIGDHAPAFQNVSWLKGSLVDQFQPGRVYVVEFWATWCGPCRMAMPHLSHLAEKYRDQLTVIGVNVKDNSLSDTTDLSYQERVKDFVLALGDGMNYSVAVDNPGQQTWNSWMTAAGLKGIPATFVIDQAGRVVWIGHPLNGLDMVIEKILAGNFDPSDNEGLKSEIAKEQQQTTALLLRFHELVGKKNVADALIAGRELLDKYPMGKTVTLGALYTLLNENTSSQARDFALESINTYAGDPLTLQGFAELLLQKDDDQSKQMAILAMQQAIERTSATDHSAYTIMAKMYHKTGKHEQAVFTQEKVINIIQKNTAIKGRDALLENALKNLEAYKSALANTSNLNVGDPSPPLTALEWLKGTPVPEFKKGQVYVVEFWATWCGPCKMAMPHLSALARKHRGEVTFIGFDVRENSSSAQKNLPYLPKVKQFVERIGDGMDYTVGVDVPEGTTWNQWMTAAGLKGIPASFVIDRNGKIAWIGHPFSGLEYAVEAVLAGPLEDVHREEIADKVKAENEHIETLREQFAAAVQAKDDRVAFNIAQEMIAKSHMGKFVFISTSIDILHRKDPTMAKQYAAGLIKDHAGDPMTLQGLAQTLIEKEDKDYQRLAVHMMEEVLFRSPSDSDFIHSLMAEIYFKAGQITKAIATQRQVLNLLEENKPMAQKEEAKAKAKENMAKYTAALRKN